MTALHKYKAILVDKTKKTNFLAYTLKKIKYTNMSFNIITDCMNLDLKCTRPKGKSSTRGNAESTDLGLLVLV